MTTTYLGMLSFCTVLYMAGILYIALLDRFQEDEAKTSLVGALSTGLLCFAAPVGGVINNRFSCRVSIMIGGAFTTVGLAASAFVPNLNCMIITGGVVVGIGFSISASGLICVVGFYFEKWRDTVLSFSFLSAGVAMFIAAPFGLFLIDNHGITASFLILACIEAHLCLFGMLSKPSTIENELISQKQKNREISANSKSKSYLDLTLLTNKSYACFLFSTSAWNFALTVAIMHLPNYVSILGGSSQDIGLLTMSFSVANLIGRLLGSLTVSKLHEKCIYVHVVVLALSGLLTSLFVIYSSLPGGAYIFAVQLGVFTGVPNVMMTSISISFVGVNKISEAYALAFVFCGVGSSTGPVIIGIFTITISLIYS
ncbi:monocarboxylate transporter 12-like [Mercenaria mercenaria]|uniref:monocarboxylate transporter 12-like n=1 Tax=Mercenaria mercenaria TaxID=6596 RepID=UPI00234F8E90|nr:monocarboxylate transporter 12-like [Mercenaria mercenaria]